MSIYDLSTVTEKRIYKDVYDIIRKYTREEGEVLILGSYNDSIIDEIDFNTIYLVDIKFGKLKHFNPDIGYFEMDLNEFITYAIEIGNKFDTIIMNSVIEHLDVLEKLRCLTRIKQLLKPNGIFILGYPNCRSMNRLLGTEMRLISFPEAIDMMDSKVGHTRMYSWKSISEFVYDTKLKLIQEKGIMFKPLPNSMMDKYFSDRLDSFIEVGKELGIKSCAYIVLVLKNE